MSECPVETDSESIKANNAVLNENSGDDRLDGRIPEEVVLLKKLNVANTELKPQVPVNCMLTGTCFSLIVKFINIFG